MGRSVQQISDRVCLFASQDTWIEGAAIQQLTKTAELASMHRVAGMPDLHPGRGYPIGAAFFSLDRLYPALVGNDIGCGMALWQTTTKVAKVNVDKFAKRLEDIEQPLDASWQETIQAEMTHRDISAGLFESALGTIGGGNHFAEFQAVERVYNEAAFTALGLDKKYLQLLVHSGSRGLGQTILVDHVARFNHDGLVAEAAQGSESSHYLARHDEAVRWAELNRFLIAKRFLAAIRSDGECTLDVNHNLVCPKVIDGRAGWLHRKGATPSDKGAVVIPGSRGDYSYVVQPVNNAPALTASLYSLAHGAGRKWKRGDCQSRLSHKYKREDLYRTALGSRVICGNKELLYDEAPQAYKKCETIVSDLVDAGLIEVIAILRPVLTFKTNGSCSS